MEKYGIDQIEKVVDLAGECVNVGYKVTHKGGVLSALALVDELSGLSSLNGKAFLEQLKELSQEERQKLNQQLKAKISIGDKDLEAKIESAGDILNEAVSLAFEAKEVYFKGEQLVHRVKVLLDGVVPVVN